MVEMASLLLTLLFCFTFYPCRGLTNTPRLLDIYDRTIENWLQSRKIHGTSKLKVCNTSLSVGGRGLFLCPQQGDSAANKGDILAYIPSDTIIHPSIIIPSCMESGKVRDHDKISWQSLLTLCAWQAKARSDCSKWISSFEGPSYRLTYSINYMDDELDQISKETGASLDIVKEAIDARYETYLTDLKQAQTWLEKSSGLSCHLDEKVFSYLYRMTISRTADLGNVYSVRNFRKGIIPLHDMINHPLRGQQHNVELLTIGSLRELIPETFLVQLVNSATDLSSLPKLKDTDLVLVANQPIPEGSELLLCYKKKNKEEMEEGEKVWNYIQYGFLS